MTKIIEHPTQHQIHAASYCGNHASARTELAWGEVIVRDWSEDGQQYVIERDRYFYIHDQFDGCSRQLQPWAYQEALTAWTQSVEDEEDDLDEERQPISTAPWIICPTCSGDGHHCRNLGAYSREEFDREFSPEVQEYYFNGAYDSTCETCSGSGKIRDDDKHWSRHSAQLNLERGVNDAGEPLW